MLTAGWEIGAALPSRHRQRRTPPTPSSSSDEHHEVRVQSRWIRSDGSSGVGPCGRWLIPELRGLVGATGIGRGSGAAGVARARSNPQVEGVGGGHREARAGSIGSPGMVSGVLLLDAVSRARGVELVNQLSNWLFLVLAPVALLSAVRRSGLRSTVLSVGLTGAGAWQGLRLAGIVSLAATPVLYLVEEQQRLGIKMFIDRGLGAVPTFVVALLYALFHCRLCRRGLLPRDSPISAINADGFPTARSAGCVLVVWFSPSPCTTTPTSSRRTVTSYGRFQPSSLSRRCSVSYWACSG